MKKKSWITTVSTIVLSTALLLSGCGGGSNEGTSSQPQENNNGTSSPAPAESAEPLDLTFGAATVGGFWYVLGGAFGDEIGNVIPGSKTTVVEGGSISNIQGIESGVFQMGFSNGQTVPEALNAIGDAFPNKAENIRSVAALYPNVFQIVVKENSDIQTVEDLKGKRVSPGIKGYSGELLFQDILKIKGLSYDDLSKVEYTGTADGAMLLSDGHIDALVGMLDVPNSSISELATTAGVRLIPIDEDTLNQLQAANDGYKKFVVPGGTYTGVDEDKLFVAGYTMLLANKDMSEDHVYTITKAIFDNQKKWADLNKQMSDLSPQYSIDNLAGPLHPGAEKFYKEAGVLK